jgi:hypothetical protein
MRGLTRVHTSCALSCEGDAHSELGPRSKMAVYLAKPTGESIGIRECRPEVSNSSVEAIFHTHNALAIG